MKPQDSYSFIKINSKLPTNAISKFTNTTIDNLIKKKYSCIEQPRVGSSQFMITEDIQSNYN